MGKKFKFPEIASYEFYTDDVSPNGEIIVAYADKRVRDLVDVPYQYMIGYLRKHEDGKKKGEYYVFKKRYVTQLMEKESNGAKLSTIVKQIVMNPVKYRNLLGEDFISFGGWEQNKDSL